MKIKNLILTVLAIIFLSFLSCSEGVADEKSDIPIYLDSTRIHPYSVSNLSFNINVNKQSIIDLGNAAENLGNTDANRWFSFFYNEKLEKSYLLHVSFPSNSNPSKLKSYIKIEGFQISDVSYTDTSFVETDTVNLLTYVNWTIDSFAISINRLYRSNHTGNEENWTINDTSIIVAPDSSDSSDNYKYTMNITKIGKYYFGAEFDLDGLRGKELVFYDYDYLLEMINQNTGKIEEGFYYGQLALVHLTEFVRFALVNASTGEYPARLISGIWSG